MKTFNIKQDTYLFNKDLINQSLVINIFKNSTLYIKNDMKENEMDLIINLREKSAKFKYIGLVQNKNQTPKINLIINHLFNETESYVNNQVLANKGSFDFNCTININKDKENCKTEFYNKSILLEHSKINIQPNMRIFNNKVEASHGVSIGEIDQNILFYMQNRHFTKEQAKQIIAKSIIQNFEDTVL